MIKFKEISVKYPADTVIARKISEEFAGYAGLIGEKCEKIKLISSELANNLLLHDTQNGIIRFCLNSFGGRNILNITSLDLGPGIKFIEDAISGRLKSATGLGKGLLSIFRLSDYVSVVSNNPSINNGGTIISTCFFNDKHNKNSLRDIDFFCVSKPWSLIDNSGDIVIVSWDDRFLRIVMVDLPGLSPDFEIYKKNLLISLENIPLFWGIEKTADVLPDISLPISVFRFDWLNMEIDFFEKGDIYNFFMGEDEKSEKIIERKFYLPINIRRIEIKNEFLFIMHTDGQKTPEIAKIKNTTCIVKTKNGFDTGILDAFILSNILFEPKRTNEDATLMVIKWKGKKTLPNYIL